MTKYFKTSLYRTSVALVILIQPPSLAREARSIKLNEKMTANITLTPGRTTILSFSSKPTRVLLGNRGSFAVEYVANDVAIAALSSSSRSNLFVYIENRRFAFDLETRVTDGDEIVVVRDTLENQLKVRVQ